MSTISGRFSLKAFRAIALVGIALTASAGTALAADDVTSDQILRALAPKKPLTRGLSMTPPTEPAVTAAEGKFVDALRNRNTRSLSAGEREQIATIAQTKPKIDLEITFDYNSANISAKAQPAVQALGKALSSDDLKGSTFVVAGHTDAVGGEAYNQDLSERRADAIKRYLVDKYGIAGADLVTVGYGKSKPKDASAPMDPANRRVQVVNMANKSTASK
jgi:outer membrane protein OmpA-like peptidoglycan-associated protein